MRGLESEELLWRLLFSASFSQRVNKRHHALSVLSKMELLGLLSLRTLDGQTRSTVTPPPNRTSSSSPPTIGASESSATSLSSTSPRTPTHRRYSHSCTQQPPALSLRTSHAQHTRHHHSTHPHQPQANATHPCLLPAEPAPSPISHYRSSRIHTYKPLQHKLPKLSLILEQKPDTTPPNTPPQYATASHATPVHEQTHEQPPNAPQRHMGPFTKQHQTKNNRILAPQQAAEPIHEGHTNST